MGDETPWTMSLDLNLEPLVPPSLDHEPGSGSGLVLEQPVSLNNWVEQAILCRTFRARPQWQPIPVLPESRHISTELVGDSVDMNRPQAGEGSTTIATDEPAKACEINNEDLGLEALGKRVDVEKGPSADGSFFACNICLDLASDPVVTCCGHLFCWPCLFRWLHAHSVARECPVCKGEVDVKNVIPIYGRGSNTREPEEDDLDLKIPIRPQARRVESLRQSIQRDSFVEELFWRLGSRVNLSRDLSPPQDPNTGHDHHSLLNQNLISHRLHREQNIDSPHNDDVVDSTQSSSANLADSLLVRLLSNRTVPMAQMNSPEPVVETYSRGHPVGRSQEQPPSVEDRDSFSSIGAVIQSGSLAMDTAVEIDSTVSHSTSSSTRRRSDASRASAVDSGESRAPRRRRVN